MALDTYSISKITTKSNFDETVDFLIVNAINVPKLGTKFFKNIGHLPVEIPVLDPEEDADFAGGEGGGHAGTAGEVVGVGGDGERVDVNGEGEGAAHLVVGFVGGDIDV